MPLRLSALASRISLHPVAQLSRRTLRTLIKAHLGHKALAPESEQVPQHVMLADMRPEKHITITKQTLVPRMVNIGRKNSAALWKF